MQKTFKRGKGIFHNFLDLQDVAEQLGYHNTGLAKLTKQVLGCAGYKSKRVCCNLLLAWSCQAAFVLWELLMCVTFDLLIVYTLSVVS